MAAATKSPNGGGPGPVWLVCPLSTKAGKGLRGPPLLTAELVRLALGAEMKTLSFPFPFPSLSSSGGASGLGQEHLPGSPHAALSRPLGPTQAEGKLKTDGEGK